MLKKANPHIIGLFVVGALGIGIVSLVFLGSIKFSEKEESFVLFFAESINGLDVGSKVKFRGVPVGQVEKILIRTTQQRQDAFHIPVLVKINTEALNELCFGHDWSKLDSDEEGRHLDVHIEAGLRGRLQLESLITGLYYIELDYFDDPPKFEPLQTEPEYLEIPTIPSPLETISQTAAGIINKLNKVRYESIGKNIETAIAKLSALDIQTLNEQIQSILLKVEEKIDTFDPQALQDDLKVTLNAIQERSKDPNIDQALERFDQTLAEFHALAEQANRLLAPQSPLRYQIERAIVDLAEAAQAVEALAAFIERNPRALISGKAKPESQP